MRNSWIVITLISSTILFALIVTHFWLSGQKVRFLNQREQLVIEFSKLEGFDQRREEELLRLHQILMLGQKVPDYVPPAGSALYSERDKALKKWAAAVRVEAGYKMTDTVKEMLDTLAVYEQRREQHLSSLIEKVEVFNFVIKDSIYIRHHNIQPISL